MFKKELVKYYWQLLAPALVLILLSETLKATGILQKSVFEQKDVISIVVFVLAALTAIGLPVVRRLLFVDKVKTVKVVDPELWLGYEKQSLLTALLTPYFFLIASVLQFVNFFYASIFLLALYACYYYFPSDKRVQFEMRMFRIEGK